MKMAKEQESKNLNGKINHQGEGYPPFHHRRYKMLYIMLVDGTIDTLETDTLVTITDELENGIVEVSNGYLHDEIDRNDLIIL